MHAVGLYQQILRRIANIHWPNRIANKAMDREQVNVDATSSKCMPPPQKEVHLVSL